jgi:hypothetical protein
MFWTDDCAKAGLSELSTATLTDLRATGVIVRNPENLSSQRRSEIAQNSLARWEKPKKSCTRRSYGGMGNPGQGERDSGMIPNSVPG